MKKSGDYTKSDIGPAVCGVYNKKTGEFYYGVNAIDNSIPNDGVKLIDERIANMPKEIEESYLKTHGKGSHAEIYAVSEALSKNPDANIDDLLIYVNDTQGGRVSKDAIYNPFVTCPHCEYILDGFNIVSNVEV